MNEGSVDFKGKSKWGGIARGLSAIIFWFLYEIIPLYMFVFGAGFGEVAQSKMIATLFPYVVLPAPFLFILFY